MAIVAPAPRSSLLSAHQRMHEWVGDPTADARGIDEIVWEEVVLYRWMILWFGLCFSLLVTMIHLCLIV
jgi:hypothetical protein